MWIRLEDNTFENPKFTAVSGPIRYFHVEALLFCGKWLTDGRVPRSFCPGKRRHGFADTLVRARVWHESRVLKTTCPDCWRALGGVAGDGWVIHDFLKYNPAKVEVEHRREEARARAAKARSQKVPESSQEVSAVRVGTSSTSRESSNGEQKRPPLYVYPEPAIPEPKPDLTEKQRAANIKRAAEMAAQTGKNMGAS